MIAVTDVLNDFIETKVQFHVRTVAFKNVIKSI